VTRTLEELCELLDRDEPCALATLVSTSGSSPQNAGAKLLVLPSGRLIGTSGGGCMEAEARRIALSCLRTRQTRLLGLRLDDDFGWDDGLICGGHVDIFVNPLVQRSAEVYRAAREASRNRKRAVLVTQLSGESAGASVLADGEGLLAGAEGFVTTDALRTAVCEVLETGREQRRDIEERDLYLEPIVPRPTLLIAGAGHIGAAVAQIGGLCGFEVIVVDDRPSFTNRERLPSADRVAVDDIPSFVRDFPLDESSYVVIVTRGHRHDAHVLRQCIHSRARYIGMIGSRRKIVVIFEEMLRDDLATKDEPGDER
jgi:xanthine dehydrogenase accessory factor